MAIISANAHPTWCAPTSCKSRLDDDRDIYYEHRSTAPVMRPAGQPDAELTLRPTQLEECSRIPSIGESRGPNHGTLTVVDTSSVTPNGDRLFVDVELDPNDLRMLAAQMVCLAEQVDALRLTERRTR